MMRPRENHSIKLDKCMFSISIPHQLRWIRDLHENNIGIVDFSIPATKLVIEGEFVLDISEENPFDFIISAEAAEYPFTYEQELGAALNSLRQSVYTQDVDSIRQWLHPIWHPGKRIGTLALLQELTSHIYRTLSYQRRMEKGVQSPAETLEKKSGSCRDSATLFVESCRFLGLAARFVSGYMYSTDITGRMSMHGWAEVYLPGAGWIGFDPSWGILASSNYFPVAVSRHSEHAPPISGSYLGIPSAFLNSHVDLYVKRLN
jgi:transglutaminase-like putative cysteine protease